MAIKRKTQLRIVALLCFWIMVLAIRIAVIWPIDHAPIWTVLIVIGFIVSVTLGCYLRKLYEEWLGVERVLEEKTRALNQILRASNASPNA